LRLVVEMLGPPPEPNPERRDIVTASEVDYFGLANLLIDQCGTDARAQATRLMRDALQQDDPVGTADWLSVEYAIALLTNESVTMTN
jgi:hypothetical protein